MRSTSDSGMAPTSIPSDVTLPLGVSRLPSTSTSVRAGPRLRRSTNSLPVPLAVAIEF